MAAAGRRSSRMLIIFAVVLIVILGVVIFLFKDQLFPSPQATPAANQGDGTSLATPQPSGAIETVEVIVLAQPVARGAKITTDMVTKVNLIKVEDYIPELYYPVSDVPEEQYSSVVGQYARYPLKEKTVLTQGMLSDTPVGSQPATLIPSGYVAIPIPISQLTSVSYALEPGDHVNVLAAIQLIDVDTSFQTALPNRTGQVSETLPPPEGGGTIQYSLTVVGDGPMQGRVETEASVGKTVYVIPSEDQRPRLVSQTLIQDATVLWVGDFPGPGVDLTSLYDQPRSITKETQEGAEVTETQPIPTVITLIVTPQDAVTLNYLLLSNAKLNLVLRSAGDTQRVQTEAVTLQFLMDQYRIPYPTKLPYGTTPRIDNLVYPSEPTPEPTAAP